MKRYWIWMIPILAAVSAIWIQAALHNYNSGAVSQGSRPPLAQRDTTEASTISPVYSGNVVKSPPRPSEPSH